MIKFRMVRISTEQFAILTKEPPSTDIKINLETQLGFKEAQTERQIACDVNFKFSVDESPFLLLNVSCVFEISKDDWAGMAKEDGGMTLPKGFLCHIAMHTVGTARGILHVKTENTPFNRYVLPTINVEQMINEDIIVAPK